MFVFAFCDSMLCTNEQHRSKKIRCVLFVLPSARCLCEFGVLFVFKNVFFFCLFKSVSLSRTLWFGAVSEVILNEVFGGSSFRVDATDELRSDLSDFLIRHDFRVRHLTLDFTFLVIVVRWFVWLGTAAILNGILLICIHWRCSIRCLIRWNVFDRAKMCSSFLFLFFISS